MSLYNLLKWSMLSYQSQLLVQFKFFYVPSNRFKAKFIKDIALRLQLNQNTGNNPSSLTTFFNTG